MMADPLNPDGIYLAYFTGEFGTSMGIFMITKNTLQGGDLGSGVYQGKFEITDSTVVGKISFCAANGGSTVTGAKLDLPTNFETSFELSLPIEAADFHRIETLNGPINVRFSKVRSL